MVSSSPLLAAVVRALWNSVELDTQKVAPKEEEGFKSSDNAETNNKVLLTKTPLLFI